ncbi:hypothetical protein [Streptomyces sp. NPDC059080]|uniref:hypothetical protein n=1 Tax=Streptomyces sp. NPDC059080 TaxID=3346718 RepID=UPI00369C7712
MQVPAAGGGVPVVPGMGVGHGGDREAGVGDEGFEAWRGAEAVREQAVIVGGARGAAAEFDGRVQQGAGAVRDRVQVPGPGGSPMWIRESRSMATVVPASSTLAIWVIDSSDVSVPVNSMAAMAAARSGLGRRTVIVCTTRAVRGTVVMPGPAHLVTSSGTLSSTERVEVPPLRERC